PGGPVSSPLTSQYRRPVRRLPSAGRREETTMETLIGAALIGIAIVVAAAVYGRARPATANGHAATTSLTPLAGGAEATLPARANGLDDEETARRTAELERSAERTHALETALDRRGADLDRREAELERREQHLGARATELEKLRVEREQALERIAG